MNDWRERARRLRSVDLRSVLRLVGARADRHDSRKWHTSRGVLSVSGARFMNWSLGQGGGGAIDLVMHLEQRGFGQALEWLEAHFTGSAEMTPPPPSVRPALALPAPSPEKLVRIRQYLVEQRRLPAALLNSLIDTGDLYADARANAVFLMRDGQRQPVGAELRGTTTLAAWQGMAPGSRKDLGFFAIPGSPSEAAEETVLCESAIDALSCHVLHPDWRCLSTAGARSNPAWLAQLAARTPRLHCGFDLDVTGEAMAQAMIAIHPSIQRLRPSRKDWNDCLRLRR